MATTALLDELASLHGPAAAGALAAPRQLVAQAAPAQMAMDLAERPPATATRAANAMWQEGAREGLQTTAKRSKASGKRHTIGNHVSKRVPSA